MSVARGQRAHDGQGWHREFTETIEATKFMLKGKREKRIVFRQREGMNGEKWEVEYSTRRHKALSRIKSNLVQKEAAEKGHQKRRK